MIIDKSQSYVAACALGLVLGTLAFVVSSLIRPPSTDALKAIQELMVWSGVGALAWCVITMLSHRYAQKVRLREEQLRKIRIAQQDG